MSDCDEKRVIALEDQLFTTTLQYHLGARHGRYLPNCDDPICVACRELLGPLHWIKYGGYAVPECYSDEVRRRTSRAPEK